MSLVKRAQTATEYLIILAVVIIIALIVVGALGGIPGIGGGAGQSTNEAYWQTSKIGIPNFAFGSTNADTLTLRNNLASSITITRVQLEGVDINATTTLTPRTLNQGQSWTFQNGSNSQTDITEDLLTACDTAGEAGSSFSVSVDIEYQDVNTGAVYTFDGDGTKLEGTCAN